MFGAGLVEIDIPRLHCLGIFDKTSTIWTEALHYVVSKRYATMRIQLISVFLIVSHETVETDRNIALIDW
jgi:hypothetical protein